MTEAQRKLLADKRAQLENERMAAMARANQATGAIAMIDSMLAMPEEKLATEAANSNGADHSEAAQANG